MSEASKRTFSRYFRPCPYDEIDLYRVFLIFGVTNPALQHAIKKLVFAGGRGQKPYVQDIQEAIAAANRAIELYEEERALEEGGPSRKEIETAEENAAKATALYEALRRGLNQAEVTLNSEIESAKASNARGDSAERRTPAARFGQDGY